jgi:predicted CoA-substrate-specific enzyme activase
MRTDILHVGVDAGTAATKAVALGPAGEIRGRSLQRTGVDFELAAERARAHALAQAGARSAQPVHTVVCGYGRNNISFADRRLLDLDCLARGAYYHFPREITAVDVGARDSMRIRIDGEGRRVGFVVNHNCAAGTGFFLEEIAQRLDVAIEALPHLARQARDPTVTLGSYCTVFAKGEIYEKIRAGIPREELARAALQSVARRVVEKERLSGDVVVSGGVVAHYSLFADLLAELLQQQVLVPAAPQFTAALGAALLSRM